jgi:hypothetical protein
MSWGERGFLLILVELLTITQWVKMRGDFYTHWVMVKNSTKINQNHHSPKLIEWWSTIPPISTKFTSHLNSLSDGQQFHQYQQKSPRPSFNELKWEVIFVDIGGIVDHHSMSLGKRWFLLILGEMLTIIQWVEVRGDFCWYWYGQQFHLYQQAQPLTLTHWVMVNNSTNINENHLSS